MRSIRVFRDRLAWLLVCLCYLASSVAMAHGKYALVIGNSAYRGADRLSTPVNDADLIAQRLKSLGFRVTSHSDRSRRDFYDDLDEFSRSAKDADILVFYYAGHGFEVGGENYLMPVDLSQPLAQLDHTSLRREGIALRAVESTLAATEARARVILVDACRGAPSRGVSARSMSAQPAANGIVLAWSTSPGGEAVDSMRQLGQNIDHSPFAWYLAGNLAQRQLDLIDVLRRTQREVSAVTDNDQRPWFSSGLVGDLRLADTDTPGKESSSSMASNVRHRGVDTPASSRQLWDREQQIIELRQVDLDQPALQALRRRASSGDSQAAAILGVAYERGEAVPADVAIAVHYYRQAARADYVPGQTLLGEAYFEGRLVPRDISKAERLLQKAADAGDTRARLDLAQLRVRRGDADAAANSIKALQQAGSSLVDMLQQQARDIQAASGDATFPPGDTVKKNSD